MISEMSTTWLIPCIMVLLGMTITESGADDIALKQDNSLSNDDKLLEYVLEELARNGELSGMSNDDVESPIYLDERSLRDFIGKRGGMRDFIGKRGGLRDFIGKRRDFIGKRRDFIGKRRDFIGKRRDFIGKRRDFIGKRRDFIGKRDLLASDIDSDKRGGMRDFVGKRAGGLRDFLGKRAITRDFVGKRASWARDFIGKRSASLQNYSDSIATDSTKDLSETKDSSRTLNNINESVAGDASSDHQQWWSKQH
ncbi:unnamed protein product [Owenia fusiformis]|uniref:Uncharacterized protein n=1 Tax=Owenia fusiformis TaxID=6347 RepID=A0A8S4NPW6_OWEFU|nr:unnamed protein product [Owenia fusiformis]